MKVIRARHLGMCFGVRDAIALVGEESNQHPVTILGELAHNEVLIRKLRERGVSIVETPEEVRTPTVVITAHGTSERRMEDLRGRGLNIVQATCPLVHAAHAALKKLVAEGYYPVVIGKRDHVEVRGLTGDLSEFDVVLSADDIERMQGGARIGVVAQTTQPIGRVELLVRLIRQRFPESDVRFSDTVCYPTKQRQAGAEELARTVSVVIVIGGAHSNNTRELVATCSRFCRKVHHVQTVDDLNRDWFEVSDTVGITAGTSTLDATVDEVEEWLVHAFSTVAVS